MDEDNKVRVLYPIECPHCKQNSYVVVESEAVKTLTKQEVEDLTKEVEKHAIPEND